MDFYGLQMAQPTWSQLEEEWEDGLLVPPPVEEIPDVAPHHGGKRKPPTPPPSLESDDEHEEHDEEDEDDHESVNVCATPLIDPQADHEESKFEEAVVEESEHEDIVPEEKLDRALSRGLSKQEHDCRQLLVWLEDDERRHARRRSRDMKEFFALDEKQCKRRWMEDEEDRLRDVKRRPLTSLPSFDCLPLSIYGPNLPTFVHPKQTSVSE